MSNHESELDAARGPSETGGRRWRTGRTRFVIRNRWGAGLLLALMVLLPGLPAPRSARAIRPARRLRGAAATPIVGLAFGPDGRTLATLDEFGLATLWDVSGGRSTERSFRVGGHARIIVPTPDGRYLAATCDEPDVVLCDPSRGDERRPLGMPVGSVSDLKFSPDGRIVAVSSFRSPDILLWDNAAGRERMTLRGHSSPVVRLAFAPGGRSLASSARDDRAIHIWDLASSRLERRLAVPNSSILSIAYSPDGRLLATASPVERLTRIWGVRTGSEVLTLAGHSAPILALAFSPDGRVLATASGDGTANLWDVATGRELRHLDGEAGSLRHVAFSPDGKTLAATANDGDVRLWEVDHRTGRP
jgi:WD40 repeat protein